MDIVLGALEWEAARLYISLPRLEQEFEASDDGSDTESQRHQYQSHPILGDFVTLHECSIYADISEQAKRGWSSESSDRTVFAGDEDLPDPALVASRVFDGHMYLLERQKIDRARELTTYEEGTTSLVGTLLPS